MCNIILDLTEELRRCASSSLQKSSIVIHQSSINSPPPVNPPSSTGINSKNRVRQTTSHILRSGQDCLAHSAMLVCSPPPPSGRNEFVRCPLSLSPRFAGRRPREEGHSCPSPTQARNPSLSVYSIPSVVKNELANQVFFRVFSDPLELSRCYAWDIFEFLFLFRAYGADVVVALEVEPDMRGGSEVGRETQGGVHRDADLTFDEASNPAVRHSGILGELVLGDAVGLEKLFEKNFSRGGFWDILSCFFSGVFFHRDRGGGLILVVCV